MPGVTLASAGWASPCPSPQQSPALPTEATLLTPPRYPTAGPYESSYKPTPLGTLALLL